MIEWQIDSPMPHRRIFCSIVQYVWQPDQSTYKKTIQIVADDAIDSFDAIRREGFGELIGYGFGHKYFLLRPLNRDCATVI
jgi:hypothetical protein